MQPNILLIMTDQQRYDSLGAYGLRAISTPTIDSIGQGGLIFDHCYVNNPVCTPSRASIFTGKALPGHGVYRLNDILPQEEKLFPEYLREAGYHTALFGKLHVSSAVFESSNRNQHDGFDRYCWNHEPVLFENSPYNEYAQWLKVEHPVFYSDFYDKRREYGAVPAQVHCTTFLAKAATDYILSYNEDTPFFCCLSFFDPHNPYNDCPQEALESVREELLPPVRVFAEDATLPEGAMRERHHGYMKDIDGYTPADIASMRKGYYGSIAFIDMQLALVFEALKTRGMMENTLVLFVSDHGDMLGDHDLLAKGAFFYDACTRVPLLIKPHGKASGARKVQQLVQPSDIAATVLAAAGYSGTEINRIAPGSMDLLDMDDETESDRPAVCLYRGTGIADTMNDFDPAIHATMFRKGKYKLNIYHGLDGASQQGQLFDMLSDPDERFNLWMDPAYVQAKATLLADYADWQARWDIWASSGRGGHTQSVTQLMTKG